MRQCWNCRKKKENVKLIKQPIRAKKELRELVRYFAYGKKIDLGCGHFPYFDDSFKIDIKNYNHDNLIIHDLNKPFPIKEKFDTVIATNIIEHLVDVDNFLKECKRILMEGGTFILSTPNILYWKIRLNILFGKNVIFTDGYHVQNFCDKTIKNKLKKHGFEIQYSTGYGISKYLGKKLTGALFYVCFKQ